MKLKDREESISKLNDFFNLLNDDSDTLREEVLSVDDYADETNEFSTIIEEDEASKRFSNMYDASNPSDPYHERDKEGRLINQDYYFNLDEDPVTPKRKYVYSSERIPKMEFIGYHNLFLTEKIGDNKLCITGLRAEPPSENLFIPDELNGCSVVAIGGNVLGEYGNHIKAIMLSNIRFLKSRSFANSKLKVLVTTCNTAIVGTSAFENCKYLQLVEQLSPEIVDDNAFKDCLYLQTIELKHCKSIGKSAFENCRTLRDVELSDALTELRVRAFRNCTSIESIYFGKALRGIDCKCFENCYKLQSIKFATSVVGQEKSNYRIGMDCFRNCHVLGNVAIPDYVVAVDSKAFYNCTQLPAVNLGSIRTLGAEVFARCSTLKRIKIPKTVETLGERCFSYSGLQQVRFDCLKLKNLKYTFAYCVELYEVLMPKIVHNLEGCFYNCKNLSEVNLPDEAVRIDYMFCGCAELEKIKIPFTVKTLAKGTFAQCRSLRKVCIPPTVTKISKTAFYGVKKCLLVVTRGSEGEKFAQRNGIDYQHLGEATVIKAQKNPKLQKLKSLSVLVLGKLKLILKNNNVNETKQNYLAFKI